MQNFHSIGTIRVVKTITQRNGRFDPLYFGAIEDKLGKEIEKSEKTMPDQKTVKNDNPM